MDFDFRSVGLAIFLGADYRTYEPPSYGPERSDADGRFVRPLMRPGRVALVVETKEGATGRATAVLRAGEETRIGIVVR